MFNSGKTLYDPSIEIAESNEGVDITNSLGYWLLLHGTGFVWVHF
jgi:hypothetical protein